MRSSSSSTCSSDANTASFATRVRRSMLTPVLAMAIICGIASCSLFINVATVGRLSLFSTGTEPSIPPENSPSLQESLCGTEGGEACGSEERNTSPEPMIVMDSPAKASANSYTIVYTPPVNSRGASKWKTADEYAFHYYYCEGFAPQFRRAELNGCARKCHDWMEDNNSNMTLVLGLGVGYTTAGPSIFDGLEDPWFFVYFQVEQCDRLNMQVSMQIPEVSLITYMLDWSPNQVALADQCYPELKDKSMHLGLETIVDPHMFLKSDKYFAQQDGSVEAYDNERTWDVLFFGTINDPRKMRTSFMNKFKHAHPELSLSSDGLLGDELEKRIRESKVLYNIHFYPGAQLETHRLNQVLMWKVPIVSEPSADKELDDYFAKEAGVIFLDPESQEFIDMIVSLVSNVTLRRELGEKGRDFLYRIRDESVERGGSVCKAFDRVCDAVGRS